MSVLCNISTAVPSNKYEQAHLANYMSGFFRHSDLEKRKLKLMYGKSGINTRYSVIPDFAQANGNNFFPETNDHPSFPSIENRMDHYNGSALPMCIEAIIKCIKKINKKQITHLISVSCTGLAAPGIDIDLVQHFKLNENTNRTSVNFMGCYAALHALKQADYICKCEENAVVLIICVELCTLHFQRIDDLDNNTANLLFADGAAAALIVSDRYAEKNKLDGFKINQFYSQVSLKGKSDMAWKLTSTGFLMTLSSNIPQLIEKDIKQFFSKAIKQLGISKQEIIHWAVHPGGKKILEVIQKELELNYADLESSFQVLKNYGNMSSPTFLFVLKDIFDTKINKEKKEKTFGVAFGPGLTMESVILENV